MANVNISKVYLLDVPLENDYKNTLYFANASAQQSYFQSRIVKSYTDFSYQRKDHIIRIPEEYDEIYHVNYVMYQNSAYSNKWFYAFITDLKYVNDGMTEAKIETDVIQTWLFDYQLKSSFVEREHVNDDTIGIHTVPEGLELGEYIVDNKIHHRLDEFRIIVGTTLDLDQPSSHTGKYPDIAGSSIGGVYNGVRYYAFYSDTALNAILQRVANRGQSDGIITMFMGNSSFYDSEVCTNIAASVILDSNYGTATWSVGGLGVDPILPPVKPTTLNTYTPINKKLLTFPYCYLMASNNAGSNAVYKYELFGANQNNYCDFRFVGTVSPGMSIRLQPLNYNNQSINNEEGLNVGKFPVCSWSNDAYTNWLTQNSVNIGLSVASSLITIVGGVAMAGTGAGALMGGGAVVSGAMGIANAIGQVYEHSLTPPQAEGNINNGDIMFASGQTGVTMYQMSIKQEYARIIDKYFDMFGYKVNMIKVPNSNHRQRYWYTKCIDVNIDGAIPQDHMQKIKNAYNTGITFWRNASEIQNYSLSNGIV